MKYLIQPVVANLEEEAVEASDEEYDTESEAKLMKLIKALLNESTKVHNPRRDS